MRRIENVNSPSTIPGVPRAICTAACISSLHPYTAADYNKREVPFTGAFERHLCETLTCHAPLWKQLHLNQWFAMTHRKTMARQKRLLKRVKELQMATDPLGIPFCRRSHQQCVSSSTLATTILFICAVSLPSWFETCFHHLPI
jgi:hypothetical protein